MSLKPHRFTLPRYKGSSFFMDEVASRGGVVVASTYGSGAALDNASHLATYASSPSGKLPLGVLMWDMVEVDLTRYKLNQHQCQVQRGAKVPITEQGWVTTDMTEGTIVPGPAYLGHSGRIRSTIDNNIANSPLVGTIESYPDEDNFVKFNYNLP